MFIFEYDIIVHEECSFMNLEREIKKIQERNKRVEEDKKWETSWNRRICIMFLTYIVVVIYSYDFFEITKKNYQVYWAFEKLLTDIKDINIFAEEEINFPSYLETDEEKNTVTLGI